MQQERKIQIPNYLENFIGENIFISGCGESLRKFDLELKSICKPSMRKYYLSNHSAFPIDKLLKLSENKSKLLSEFFKSAEGFASRANLPHKLPRELSYELAYFIGALRDGCITVKDYSVRISQSGKGSRKWLKILSKYLTEIFGLRCKITKHGKENILEAQSKPLNVFLRKVFEMPTDQSLWATPKLIRKNKEAWIPYVSGFFDAEGYCTSRKTFLKTKKVKIAFFQNNLDSIKFIKKVLNFYGIKTSNIYLEKNRKCHALFIQSKSEIEKFANIFNPIRKKSRINELLKVIKDRKAGSFRNVPQDSSAGARVRGKALFGMLS